MRPKFLIIVYGGTITMVMKDKRVQPASDISEILELLPRLNDHADLDLEILSNKDSTNVNHTDWTQLSRHLAERMDQYDGFLITHGTNTMAYTASALSLALGSGLKKPVVITGSQLPLTVFGNDARFNFENAVKVLTKANAEQVAEVMIVFDDLVLRGSRSVKVSESSFRAFRSPAFPPIGEITATGVQFSIHAKRIGTEAFVLRPDFAPGVLSIDLTPGQLPDLFETIVATGRCKGIILKSHGAGSVPTDGAYNFLPFIHKTVHQYLVPVIISTKFLGGNSFKEINDACAVEALEAGAIPSGDLTDVMTEVKLMWILAQGVTNMTEIKQALLRETIGEVSSQKLQAAL
jgi:L-asparaginase